MSSKTIMLAAASAVMGAPGIAYAWTEYRRSPAIGLSVVLSACGGLYFVWFPAHATILAEAVGIGRGVDLIIYIWVVISLLIVFNLHLKLRSQMELITGLAREIAILKVAPASHVAPSRPATPH